MPDQTFRSETVTPPANDDVRERFAQRSVERRLNEQATMASFKGNFLAGILIGAALAVFGPIAATGLIAGISLAPQPARAQAHTMLQGASQTVNRGAKSDRLRAPKRATGEQRSRPAILVGCDPAFSPLSKSADINFASRCLS